MRARAGVARDVAERKRKHLGVGGVGDRHQPLMEARLVRRRIILEVVKGA